MIIRQLIAWSIALIAASAFAEEPIDRYALVSRHNPSARSADPLTPFSLGNGSFTYTADVTGLQSFSAHYAEGIPLAIQSEWAWHTFPNTGDYKLEDTFVDFDTYGRPVPYPFDQNSKAGQWLRGNPHRLGLGRIGFEFTKADGTLARIDDIQNIVQALDLWTGLLTSRFTIEGIPVTTLTACHPREYLIAATVSSPLIKQGKLKVFLEFGYGSSAWGIEPVDWEQEEKHITRIDRSEVGRVDISRTLDDERHFINVEFTRGSPFEQKGAHAFTITPHEDAHESFFFSARFSPIPEPKADLPDFAVVAAESQADWQTFWQTGGAISLAGSTHPRAEELERRMVLSQYLTAIQCRTSHPPQETGLTYNSWYGKPHLEMHWWHGVHFALWDRLPALADTLPWYQTILPKAQAIARVQGYEGARWPKNVDQHGNQVPSTIAPLLVWQQPHPIYFAELCYRQIPTQETLREYQELVFETADFMASFAHYDPVQKVHHLGPPLIPAQESYDPATTRNPPFELAYWRWGLETAQSWRERLGLPRNKSWDAVIETLAPYPLYEDLYATAEGVWNTIDHPTVLAAYGMIPGADIDKSRMLRTLRNVMKTWPWEHTWGWDYPMIAMTAARIGEPGIAIDALLLDVPKNMYLNNGHNYQEPENLRLYLPGNGGLLAAVAMMAAGWDGAPDQHAPGFPQDGSWKVRWENLHKLP